MTEDPNVITCPRYGSRVNPICWRCWVELGGIVYKWQAPKPPEDEQA